MIVDAEFFPNDLGEQRRGPDSGRKSVGDGPTFYDIQEMLALFGRQFARPTGSVTFLAEAIPIMDPSMDTGTMDMKERSDARRSVAIDT